MLKLKNDKIVIEVHTYIILFIEKNWLCIIYNANNNI